MSRTTKTRAGLALCATIVIVPGIAKGELFDLSDPASIEIQSQIESSGNLANQTDQAMVTADLNGDQCDDIVVGVQGKTDGSPGQVIIYYGSVTRGPATQATCDPKELTEIITSASDSDGFGTQLAVADFNADGVADLAVSAPYLDVSGGIGKPIVVDAGAVYVFFGGTEGLGKGADLKVTAAELTLLGTEPNEKVGIGLADAGDVTSSTGEQDGVSDLWIAEVSSGHGRIFVLPGNGSDWENGTQAPDKSPLDDDTRWFALEGESSAADVFGFQMLTQWIDDQPYLVASDYWANEEGTTYNDGQVYRTAVVSNTRVQVSVSDPAVETFKGEAYASSWFGYSLALLPQSGEADSPSALWIGAPKWGRLADELYRGKLYIPPDYQAAYIDSQNQIDGFGIGRNIVVLPDLDHDGLPEVALGSPGECVPTTDDDRPAPGRVYLARAADLIAGRWEPLATVSPESRSLDFERISSELAPELLWLDGWTRKEQNDCFGNNLVAGDFNGDGHPDVAVMAPTTVTETGTGLLTILWSVDTLFDQDGDRVIAYAGVPESEDLFHHSEVSVKAHDCNDSDASVYPSASETCNGVDDNCNDAIDEEVTTNYYPDEDGDGYGDKTRAPIAACPENAPDGGVPVPYDSQNDCDDFEEKTYPGANERCDGDDNNCDGRAKGEDDVDEDGYCSFFDDSLGTLVAHAPEDKADCDDNDIVVHPDAPRELCDGKDTDCNGVLPAGMADEDGDGVADGETDEDGDDYFPCQFDCNDSDRTINPAASVNAGLAPDAACKSGSSVRLESGCGAVQLNAAMAFLIGPALLATRRRRRSYEAGKRTRE